MNERIITAYIIRGFKDLAIEIFGVEEVEENLKKLPVVAQNNKPDIEMLNSSIYMIVRNYGVKMQKKKREKLSVFIDGKKTKLTIEAYQKLHSKFSRE